MGPPISISLSLVHVLQQNITPDTAAGFVLPYVITPSLIIPRVRAPLPLTPLINTVGPPIFKPPLSQYIPSIRAAIFIIHTTILPLPAREKKIAFQTVKFVLFPATYQCSGWRDCPKKKLSKTIKKNGRTIVVIRATV